MSNITLKTAIRVNGWANTTINAIQKRYETKDRGQTAFEYLGIILVVVAIIGGMVAPWPWSSTRASTPAVTSP